VTAREDTATLREDAVGVREAAAQVRQDLRESQDLLAQTTGRLAEVGGWQLTVKTQTLIWTEEVCRIHEVDPAMKPTVAEMIRFYAPEARPVITAALQAASDAGTSFDVELPLMTARGRHIWVRVFGIAKRRDGKTIRVYGALQDVTQRKRAEETLAESQRELAAIFDAAADGILLAETEGGKFRSANASICRMLGYSQDEILDLGVSDIYRKEDVAYAVQEFERHVRGESALSVNLRVKRKDGSVFFADVSSAPVTLGSKSLVVGIFRDITERKEAEDALRESAERFGLAVNATNDGMWDHNLRDGTIHFNEPYVAAFGMPSENEDPWRWWTDHVHPEDRDRTLSSFDAAVNGSGDVWKCEYRFRRIDGAWANTSDCAYITRDSAGKAQYLIGALSDTTERKRAEEERAKLETQLRQAQKMESVGRLAGGVAHDFNNMLGVILGHAELALAQVDPAQPVHDDLLAIHAAANRSADLTRQLLAFARKQTVAPQVLDLNETVGAMLGLLRRLIGEDIDLLWWPGKHPWRIRVDPSQIDQILANLCVNARDAIAGVGKVTIETATTTFDDAYCANHPGSVPGQYVRLAVSDDGCGMDKDTLSHLFEPFFTTKVLGQGTGLGLSTVYGIVKQNQGFVNVYSEPEQGTTFTIYLPRHVTEAGQARTTRAAKPASRGHETILLVEDDPAVLTMTTKMLTGLGYTVLAARSPVEAIRVAGEQAAEIHLVMTDVVMPEMNGRDLAATLLALYPNLKCLFASGYTANVIAHHGVLDEGVQFLQKPFSVHDLAAKVREVLDAS
jgi:PAS domain S-box-containing protein